MAEEHIVFFEKVDAAVCRAVERHLRRGGTVYFFEIDERCRTQLAAYLDTPRLVDASGLTFDWATVYAEAASRAHENVDRVFARYFSSASSIRQIERLLGSEPFHDMYKYELLKDLEKAYRIQLKVNRILTTRKNVAKADFYPSTGVAVHLDESCLLPGNVRVIGRRPIRTRVQEAVARIRGAGKLLYYPVAAFIKRIDGISKHTTPRRFKIGVSVHYPARVFAMNYWFLETILVDGQELSAGDVLFIDERGRNAGPLRLGARIDAPNASDYQRRGFQYVNLPDVKVAVSIATLWNKIIRRFVPVWLNVILLSLVEPQRIASTNLVILCDYVTWQLFSDGYHLDNYVRALNPDTQSRTRILSENGTATWFVYNDCTSVDYSVDGPGGKPSQTHYSFACYDNIAVYGDVLERYIREHRNRATRFVRTGVVSSQLVAELAEGKLASPVGSIVREKELPRTRIAVFDTAFVQYGTLKPWDGERFGRDILRLLNEMPEIGLIYKASRWRGAVPELNDVYDELERHDRCVFFYRWNEPGVSAVEVISLADLVISATFVSTTAEAWAAHRKAIYYDVNSQYVGHGYYYDRVPNIMAHGYDDLKHLVDYWLYRATNEEFGRFLETYVRDELDPYLDMRGLSRLRRLLLGQDHSEAAKSEGPYSVAVSGGE